MTPDSAAAASVIIGIEVVGRGKRRSKSFDCHRVARARWTKSYSDFVGGRDGTISKCRFTRSGTTVRR